MEQGFGAGDRKRQLKLAIGQLREALLRNARLVVGIGMHTQGMSLEKGVSFFEKEAYLTPTSARVETERGTSDPTYLYYNLGKLLILKLRKDYEQLRGDHFTLKDFHDRFLSCGMAPIPLVQKLMWAHAPKDVPKTSDQKGKN